MTADLVLLGAAVHTVDPARPHAEGVAIAGGRIVAVGHDEEIHDWIDPSTRVLEQRSNTSTRSGSPHVQFVHPDDLPRFATLGVVANMTPLWAALSGYVEDLTLPHVSAAAAAGMYPLGSIIRSGGRLAFGSDWSVSTPDPLLQLEVAVNRRLPEHAADRVLLPDERVDLATAVATATLGSAYVNHLDEVTGSIEVGKLADLVVLDRDLFDRGAGAISGARVDATLVEGEVVYAVPGSALS